MQAYKLATTQLLQALIQCRGSSADQEDQEEQEVHEVQDLHEPAFSAMATALLEELDIAVEDIDMLSGQMHPRVNEIIAALEALNEPGIPDILASVRTSLPAISALATATLAYMQAYESLEDSELLAAEQLLNEALEEAGEEIADDFRDLESELERQLINYSFAPLGESQTIH